VDFDPHLYKYPSGSLSHLLTSTNVSTGINKCISKKLCHQTLQVFYNYEQTTNILKIVINPDSATTFLQQFFKNLKHHANFFKFFAKFFEEVNEPNFFIIVEQKRF
jgi:hypothetical protein